MTGDGKSRGPTASLLWGDFRRGAAVAVFGCALLAVVDYIATLVVYPAGSAGVGAGNALRLVVLVASLAAVLWLLVAPLLGLAAVAARGLAIGINGERGRSWDGLLAGRAASDRPGAAAPWLIAVTIAAGLFVLASTVLTYDFTTRFKEPVLRALLLAILQLGLIAIAGGICVGLVFGLRAAGRALHPRLADANPFGRVVPALGLLLLASIPGIRIFLEAVPQARELIPWRHLLALAALTGGCYAGVRFLAWRGRLLPADRRRRRIAGAAAGAGLLGLWALSFLSLGGHPETKYMAITSSPTMSRLIELVRSANDFDGDGYGSLLGENDCGPFDAEVHPGARDLPDNGIDENCNGRDFSLSSMPTYRKGERMAMPDEFLRDWNFLLITVDTVRYDHTSMAGYERDTTPNLKKLADRSVNFTFANAPSAGTMASIPAILTSKFFHSGIALDENVKRGMPPRLKPSNVLLSEILKRRDYQTGAILSHEYFNDWGMEQGFDDYDNSLGKRHDPRSITSPGVTDRAVAWMARHTGKRWFLWAHYLDPHGHYIAHPGGPDYGDSEKDRYHGELHFTDRHIGRLLDELGRMPDANRTVVVITSDHGDGFNEHGFINHGQALYNELIHVPLIIYVPDLPPRNVGGAVSNLDIVPTVADLAGIDTSDLSFEGESLVPQLFYGRDASDRVVFAETNWPRPLRAAITGDHKLVFKMKSNVYELYDLAADPGEKDNIANRNSDVMQTMRGYLDDWLERVYFSRDPETNQAAAKLGDFILSDVPKPTQRTAGVTFDDGRIAVYGVTPNRRSYRPGDKLTAQVFFHVVRRPTTDYRIQLEAWPTADGVPVAGARPAKGQLRYTAKGLFPSGRWRDGEYIRDRFGFNLPKDWTGDAVVFGLRMKSKDGTMQSPTGETRADKPELAIIGSFPLQAPNPANPPKPQ